MPFLDKTKYKNNVRTIVGTPQIYPDDVILLCDTSIGPVTINLLDIPTDFWNTQWQMYILDKSGNASVNNITIVAGVGQVINGSANLVLNTNNAYANIRISGNGKYIATTSVSGGGATINGHVIQDEGVPLPQQPILDFVGAGVTATNGVGKTIVTIPGTPIIPITNANLKLAVSGNTIIPGAYYLVTDPNFADQGVLVTGIITNGNTSVQGVGLYLNADYQGVGDYSGVPGFTAWKNIWKPILVFPINIGDVVIYNNLHYKNLTGVNFDGLNPPSADLINWQVIPKSVTSGYIRATDFVYYDIISNNVITRIDNKQNEVDLFVNGKGENSLLLFQWGRNSTFSNKVKSGSLYWNANSYCTSQTANRVFNGGAIYDSTFDEPGIFDANICEGIFGRIIVQKNSGTFTSNVCSNGYLQLVTSYGIVSGNTIDSFGELQSKLLLTPECAIIRNKISNFSKFDLKGNTGGQITYNSFTAGGILDITTMSVGSAINNCEVATMKVEYINYNRVVEKKRVVSGFSNWDEVLDFNDPAIWDGVGGLTIPIIFKFVGIFTTQNSATGVAVTRIFNGPGNHDFRLQPFTTTNLQVTHTPVGGSGPGNMLCDASPSTNVLNGRVDGTDFVEYRASGNLYLRTNIVVVN